MKEKGNWHIIFHYIQVGYCYGEVFEGISVLSMPSVLIYSHIKCLQIQDITSLSPITQRCFQVVFLIFM